MAGYGNSSAPPLGCTGQDSSVARRGDPPHALPRQDPIHCTTSSTTYTTRSREQHTSPGRASDARAVRNGPPRVQRTSTWKKILAALCCGSSSVDQPPPPRFSPHPASPTPSEEHRERMRWKADDERRLRLRDEWRKKTEAEKVIMREEGVDTFGSRWSTWEGKVALSKERKAEREQAQADAAAAWQAGENARIAAAKRHELEQKLTKRLFTPTGSNPMPEPRKPPRKPLPPPWVGKDALESKPIVRQYRAGDNCNPLARTKVSLVESDFRRRMDIKEEQRRKDLGLPPLRARRRSLLFSESTVDDEE